jgi:thiamine pyrophosphokinase
VISRIIKARQNNKNQVKVICADSGAHLIYPEISSDYLIGDLDSISPEILQIISKSRTRVVKYPREKDFTDFHLALSFALSLKPAIDEIIVFGGLSRRLDQIFANIYTAACFSMEHGIKISIHENNTAVYLLNNHFKKLELTEDIKAGDTVSLRPLFYDATVKSASGLKYGLKNDTLRAADTRGVSNEVIGDNISLEILSGELVLIHIKKTRRAAESLK